MAPLLLAYHPKRLGAERPLLLDDWLELIENGKQECVNAMIGMCADLHQHGEASRYIKKFSEIAIWELKKRMHMGGARVYFFWTTKGEVVLVHAECKKENKANVRLLNEVAEVILAYGAGDTIFKGGQDGYKPEKQEGEQKTQRSANSVKTKTKRKATQKKS
jgi:phage-related protein